MDESQPALAQARTDESKIPRAQFSSRELGVWTFFAGVFLAIVTRFGIENTYLWFQIVCFLSVIGTSLALMRFRVLWICTLGVFQILLCLGGVLSFLIQFLIIGGGLWFIAACKWKFNTSNYNCIKLAMLVLLGSLGAMLCYKEIAFQPIKEARAIFPIVDLTDRVKFEHPPIESRPLSRSRIWDEIGSTRYSSPSSRTWQLASIHSEFVEHFITTPGAGISRVPVRVPEKLAPIQLRTIELQVNMDNPTWPVRRESFPQGEPTRDFDSNESSYDFSAFARPPANGRVNDIHSIENPWKEHPFEYEQNDSNLHYHLSSILDFASHKSTGFVLAPDKKAAVGFIEHGFHHPPPDFSRVYGESVQHYRVQKLELVGILMSQKPRVYVLDHLPRMDELKQDDVETRELDAFETYAFDKMVGGQDIVLEQAKGKLRMMGAIRSFASCTSCHGGRKGDLLGAFSYRFERLKNKKPKPFPRVERVSK